MRKLLLVLPLLGMAQATWAQSKVATVDWSERAPKGATLAVVLAPAQPRLDGIDDAGELGPGAPAEAYVQFFREAFPEALRKYSALGEVVFPATPDMRQWAERVLPVTTKDEIRLVVPPEQAQVATTPTASFVLVIYDLQISRGMRLQPMPSGPPCVPGGVGPGTPGSRTGPPCIHHGVDMRPASFLAHEARFFLWDNRTGALVSYGWLKEGLVTPFPRISRKTWTGILERLARAIIEDSLLWEK